MAETIDADVGAFDDMMAWQELNPDFIAGASDVPPFGFDHLVTDSESGVDKILRNEGSLKTKATPKVGGGTMNDLAGTD
jgi:hypothetical protein